MEIEGYTQGEIEQRVSSFSSSPGMASSDLLWKKIS